MTIDVAPELLTAIRPERIPRDATGRTDLDRPRSASPLDRVMNRVMTSRSTWLVPILIVQGALSLRPSAALSASESSSISAGHQLIAHLLHGTSTAHLGADVSGVPAVYAVPAAMLGDIGGPRLVGLVCALLALIATGFVYLATRKLFGQGPALIAAAVLSLNGSSLFVARFASADALCLALLAAGAWLSVTGVERRSHAVALGPCLILAAAASYLALAFIPAALALLAIPQARRLGARRTASAVGLAVASLAVSAGVGALLVSSTDLTDLHNTMLGRQVMSAASQAAVHHQLWTELGPLLLAGALAVVMVAKDRLLTGVLVAAVLIPVAVQTHLGTANPVQDNAALAVVFLAPVIGLTGMAFLRRGRLLGLRVPLATIAMVALLTSGLVTANHTLRDQPIPTYSSTTAGATK